MKSQKAESYCRREHLPQYQHVPVPGRLLEPTLGQPDLHNKGWLLLTVYRKKEKLSGSLLQCCLKYGQACQYMKDINRSHSEGYTFVTKKTLKLLLYVLHFQLDVHVNSFHVYYKVHCPKPHIIFQI